MLLRLCSGTPRVVHSDSGSGLFAPARRASLLRPSITPPQIKDNSVASLTQFHYRRVICARTRRFKSVIAWEFSRIPFASRLTTTRFIPPKTCSKRFLPIYYTVIVWDATDIFKHLFDRKYFVIVQSRRRHHYDIHIQFVVEGEYEENWVEK